MLSIFANNPTKRLEKEYRKILQEARDVQRKGDLKLYAQKMVEAENIAKKIVELSIN